MKVKYKDGTVEEFKEAEEWELYDECIVGILDKEGKEICAINLDVVAKIE